MKRNWALLFSFAFFIAACGGGGGGPAAPVASGSTFPLNQVFINTLTSTGTSPLTISGTADGAEITGSGTVTEEPLIDATFANLPAKKKTTKFLATFVFKGETRNAEDETYQYVDNQFNLLGEANQDEYSVVTMINALPNAARVADTGKWYEANRYTNSENTFIGTTTVTYVLEADTANTAILTLTAVDKDSNNLLEETRIRRLRITPTGDFTPLRDQSINDRNNVTISF